MAKSTESWVYQGQRYQGKGKTYHAWQDIDGQTLYYDKLKAHVVGGRYEVEVDRTGDGGVVVSPSTLRFTGHRIDELAELEAADVAARTRAANDRLERKMAADTELDQLLERLSAIAQRQRTWADRAAFLSYVNAKLGNSW